MTDKELELVMESSKLVRESTKAMSETMDDRKRDGRLIFLLLIVIALLALLQLKQHWQS